MKNDLPAGIEPITSEAFYMVTLHLNAKGDNEGIAAVEDAIDAMLEEHDLGYVGNDTSCTFAADGSISACDIEIVLFERSKDAFGKLCTFITDHLIVPKGSTLTRHTDDGEVAEVVAIGDVEGLEIALNAIDLPQEVYRSSDINEVCEALEKAMNGKGYFYGSFGGEQYMSLYFYGSSYEEMRSSIREVVAHTPLCDKCIITKIA